jgi:Uma2 family endonuclease
MTTAQPVSVEEYLHTSFEYDAEYVEGKIVYRSLPQLDHSEMQGNLYSALREEGRSRGYKVWPELRIRTKRNPARFRVPDLCLTLGKPDEQILTSPPFLCVEILSPEDSALELRTKVDEFLNFGVLYIWVIDPTSGAGEIYTPNRIAKIANGQFSAGEIHIDLSRFD